MTENTDTTREVKGCYCGDLLSWVMGRAKADDAWLTVMGNVNAIAVASLADTAGIILVEDAVLDADAKARAEQQEIAVYGTSLPAFETALKIATIDDEGMRLFDAELERVSTDGKQETRTLVLHVTDPELLARTGGIVQGMSGCPILQDGKLVGAVTHVFVDDATRGYGIFAETMLENLNEN